MIRSLPIRVLVCSAAGTVFFVVWCLLSERETIHADIFHIHDPNDPDQSPLVQDPQFNDQDFPLHRIGGKDDPPEPPDHGDGRGYGFGTPRPYGSGGGGGPTARSQRTCRGVVHHENPPEHGPGEREDDTGDPVLLHNGMVSYRSVDLRIPGRGLDVVLARRYSSKASERLGRMGYGWHHSYEARLEFPTSGPYTGKAVYRNSNNRQDPFTPDGSGGYTAPAGVFAQLKYDSGPQVYTLRFRNGTRKTFRSDGLMTAIADVHGNTIQFTYVSGTDKLQTIVDTLGRVITFDYGSNGRVSKVTDFFGREVQYGYDADKNLQSVTSPAILSTGGFDDFPSGKTEYYEYLTGTGQVKLDHNLWRVIKPNDVTSATSPFGVASRQFEYCEEPTCPWFDYCVKQTLGGDNGSGPSGGEIQYDYDTLDNTTALQNPNVGRVRTWVINRRGFQTRYDFNEFGEPIEIEEFTSQAGTSGPFVPGEPASYLSKFEYDSNWRILKATHAEGNYEVYSYEGNGTPWGDGNLTKIERYPGPRAADQTKRTVTMGYEPVFNALCWIIDERGNDAAYVPDNGGVHDPNRYRTEFLCDYMEGNSTLGDPDDVADDIATELWMTRSEAVQLLQDAGVVLRNADLNGDGRKSDVRGDVIAKVDPFVSLPNLGGGLQQALEGDGTQEAVWTWTYNALGQIRSETNAEENTTVLLYYPSNDPDGDGTPVDPNTVHDPNDTGGYLRTVIRDVDLPYSHSQLSGVVDRNLPTDIGANSARPAPAVEATIDLHYDPVGNITAVVDPRGVETAYHRTEHNEVWKILRASSVAAASTRVVAGWCDPTFTEDLTGQAFSYETRVKRDANGNVVEVWVENRDNVSDTGVAPGFIETRYAYDILDRLVRQEQEWKPVTDANDPNDWIITTLHYDENENLTGVVKPEGNIVTALYGSRDLVWRLNRGDDNLDPSDASASPLTAVYSAFYDGNRNLVVVEDAEDNNGDGLGDAESLFYDGYDRLIEIRNAVGAQILATYDPSSNIRSVLERGHVGGPSPINNGIANNVDLAQTELLYDERSRPFQLDRVILETGPSAPTDGALTPGDQRVTELREFDRLNRETFRVEDDKQAYEQWYDGLDRVLREVDPASRTVNPESNERRLCYDDNGNLYLYVEREVYPDGATVSNKFYETYRVFDSLNRVVSTTDDLGHTERLGYDARDLVISMSDAEAPLDSGTVINGHVVNFPGNTKRFFHDGLGRLVQVERDLRDTGDGSGTVQAVVIQSNVYDRNSRVTGVIDDNGNAISYEYDDLDRMEKKIYEDLSKYIVEYDREGNLKKVTDPSGNVIDYISDAVNRFTTVTATINQNATFPMVGTTRLLFEYDGLDRLTRAEDNVNGVNSDGDDWVVSRTWDSLSRLTTEVQGGRTVQNTWTEEAKRLSCAYPSGLTIDYGYDVLDRLETVTDVGGLITQYTYAGQDRVLEREIPANGTSLRLYSGGYDDTNYYDAIRRAVKMDHLDSAQTLLTGFEYGFDRQSNRIWQRRLHDSSEGDNFVYDSLYRLETFECGVDASDVGKPGGTSYLYLTDWEIDGVNNWDSVTINGMTATSTVSTENEYNTFGWSSFSYDENGNLRQKTTGPLVKFFDYDVFNRLRKVSSGGVVVEHDYDAVRRRVRTERTGVSEEPGTTVYLYDGQDVIEEVDGSGALTRRFVLGWSTDEYLRLENVWYDNPGTYYYEEDGNGNVVALTDSQGAVVERYTYDAYGLPIFRQPSGTLKVVDRSDYGNPYLFTGRHFDPDGEVLYYYRARHYSPIRGRFVQRDPIGEWGDPVTLGNAFVYVGNNPWTRSDPTGLRTMYAGTSTRPREVVNNTSPAVVLVLPLAAPAAGLAALDLAGISIGLGMLFGEGDVVKTEDVDNGGSQEGSAKESDGAKDGGDGGGGRSLEELLENGTVREIKRFLRRRHPKGQPYCDELARKIWEKIKELGRQPRLDPGHASGEWTGPHINVEGTNWHIPVSPTFVP